MQNKNEKTENKFDFAGFLQKNRKLILILVCVVIAAVIASIALFSVFDVMREKAITAVEDLGKRYEDIKSTLNEEESQEEVLSLLDDLTVFAEKKSGYAGGRAWYIIASIYTEKNEWEQAENAWVNAAKKIPKTYMSPLAWFNAGASAEELGKPEEAINYYLNSISAPAGFSSAPRAQFSIGRLWEQLDNDEEAISAYQEIISKWPEDQVWPNIAHSRIIYLETKEFRVE